ncbi:hypothetical protein QYE76_007104 [Lolium multiflorum]|uniref:Arabidopsis retrotransposon Orf1 C-terminal domain-containing protein n=1 Tax=Lolium multiflorum TaxID=4521 RepID=A0AAD8RYG3_LOLMU|nr:hypothetical protein QYE76_007104 [Lolium multiflorum]
MASRSTPTHAIHAFRRRTRWIIYSLSARMRGRKRTPDDAEELLAKIGRNHDDWSTPEPTPTPIVKKRGMIKLNDEDMREAKKSLKEKGIKPEDVKNLPPIEDICETIPSSSMIEKGKMKKFKFGELFKKATTSTGRPSRASTQIRRSYNEDVIAPSFAPEEDHGAPNASSFPCYEFLTNAGILDDFFTLVNRAGLATYVGDERGQYYRLTKVFVESFKFHNTEYEPTVAFKIYDIPVTMKLEEFCCALGIAHVGTARRIDDNPRNFWSSTGSRDDCRTIQRGKIRNIQLPAIKYFAYYIGTSILGRENTSNISSYHLAFLNVALTGETPYHLGSLIARRLSSRGPIFGGTIALRILTHLDIPLDSNDVPLTPRKLDIAAMKSHRFVTTDSTIDNMVYRMLFADGNEKEISLPQPGLFNIDRQSWSLTKEAVEEHMKIQEFHQQHDSETSYDYVSPPTFPPAHTWNRVVLRHIKKTPHGDRGNELHLGQKPKLGGVRVGVLLVRRQAFADPVKWSISERGPVHGGAALGCAALGGGALGGAAGRLGGGSPAAAAAARQRRGATGSEATAAGAFFFSIAGRVACVRRLGFFDLEKLMGRERVVSCVSENDCVQREGGRAYAS